MTRLAGWVILLALWGMPQLPPRTSASQMTVPPPGQMDLCPVCGMMVSKYPNWTATVVWKDGRAHYFDGAKDLFKFLQALPHYAPGRTAANISVIAVTEFYDLKKIDARQAFYVTGSDVLGPMGHEMVPLATKGDAEGFLQDHHGRRLLRFDDVTPAIIAGVDEGRF